MRLFAPAAIALACVTLTSAGRANGRFPAAGQIVTTSTDPSFVVARTTFGVLVSRDRATTFDWVCEGATGSVGSEDPALGLLADGHIIGGIFEGLAFSSDHGCDWHLAGGVVTGKVIIDTVVRRESPNSALALATVYAGENDAGVRYASQVYATTDGGTTWAAYGTPLVEDARVETLEVAASDPHRLYVSGVRGSGVGSVATLFVSMDDGATWLERPIPTEKNAERAPYLAGVDPTNADRVYVRTESDAGSRLLVTDNAGMTFTNPFKGTGAMLGFALSPDGTKVFLGGPDDGLWTANKTDLNFAKRSPIHVQCLATEGKTLFACSDENSGFIVGSSEDDGATFAPKLHVYGVRGPIACPASASTSVCVAQWPPLRDALANGAPDAGDADADVDAAVGPQPSGSGRGCSCSLGASDGATLASGAALGALTIAALRRRRRKK